jgi:hypothetical protein
MPPTKVKIPCSIESIATTPIFIEVDGKPVPRDRHTLRIKLPNGHTMEAILSYLELQKLEEIVPEYLCG